MAVLFEVDGAVIDMHMDGHRVAFNRAFTKVGYECVMFTPPIYNDLLTTGDGSGEGLVHAYFATAGWPQMMATSDRPLFAVKVHSTKQQELKAMILKDEVPLRQGVKGVITDALADGATVAFIAGTLSDETDDVASSVLRQLGPEAAAQVRVFNCAAPGGGETQGDDSSASRAPSMSEAVQAAAAQERKRSAEAFVRSVRSSDNMSIALDNNLTAAGGRRSISPEYLAALAAALDVPLSTSIMIASSASVASAARAANMVPVAVPRKMALQGSYPGVAAKVEGYGAGLLTWPRLKALAANASGQSQGKS